MLNSEVIDKIEKFVYEKPRSVQEIANHININWRTADRYIESIEKNFGTISTRTFRGGTKGALKIAFWASIEKISPSIFQERLEQEIFNCKKKEDFSSFDIFQYVPNKNKSLSAHKKEEDNIEEFNKILLNAKKQILFFSGNLSFINLKDKNKDLSDIFEELAKRKISMKVLCRVDLAGKNNLDKALALNTQYGRNVIEIRHDNHPIRGVVIDNNLIRLKEVKEPTGKINELNKKAFIYYNIKDKSWAEWLSKIFWKKFTNSIDANKRLEHLNKIKL